MHPVTILLIFESLLHIHGDKLATTSPSHVLPTTTPCIATKAFLEELRKMLLQSEGQGGQETANVGGKGGLYTRWGRKECPSGSHLVYTGSAGGSYYNHKAGPANTLCLPAQPEYGNYTTSYHDRGYIYGTEYETSNQLPEYNNLKDQDVPCAVCKTRVNRNILMIPAKKSCPRGWRQEYTGYLMGGHYNSAASDYLCVDGEAQPLNSGHENKNGHLLYLIEGTCGPLPCPPYKKYWELTCVVCSQ